MASSSVKSTVPLPDTIIDPETKKTYKKGKFLGKVCCVFVYCTLHFSYHGTIILYSCTFASLYMYTLAFIECMYTSYCTCYYYYYYYYMDTGWVGKVG